MRVTVDEFVLLAAVRYALGRHTYAVGLVIDEAKAAWRDLSDQGRGNITRDVREHVERGDDWPFDLDSWRGLVAWIDEQVAA